MKKILYKTIVCLLIPSFVFAQPYPYQSSENSIKQTDLARLWNALNGNVGQQIISYIETTVGSIKLEQAKAFTTAEGEIAFVPIKSFGKVLAAICYSQLKDGAEYLFLITYNTAEKGVSFTFPSGQMYVLQASGVKESMNPDFQFQPYDDLNNKVGITDANSLRMIIERICVLARIFVLLEMVVIFILFLSDCLNTDDRRCDWLVPFFLLSAPFLFIVPAYLSENSNIEMISILFAVYYYGCLLALYIIPPSNQAE